MMLIGARTRKYGRMMKLRVSFHPGAITCVCVCACVRAGVTSLSYSLSLRSRWYGYHVCDVGVTVEGPCDWLEEVCSALGRMNNFTTFNWCNDTDNDSDTVSQIASEHVHVDIDTQHTDSDCKIVDAKTHTDSDCIS